MTDKNEEANLRRDQITAQEIIERIEPHSLEQQCRAAANWLGRDESAWKELVPLLKAIEAGRLKALRTRVWTPEEIKSWQNYLMNR
jgi:hypothetical protein